MREHEYALIGGINRAAVGRYIGMISAAVSGALVFFVLSAVDLATYFGISVNAPPTVLALVSAGAVFAVLYALFDRYLWCHPRISRLLDVPDLRGDWAVSGSNYRADSSVGHSWNGKLTIVQSWDRIKVRLHTEQSESNSISASLMCDKASGYRLLYSYRNEPRIDQSKLKAHRGFAEIAFAHDCQSGTGEYFNGHGRRTFGTVSLRRF